MSESQTVRAEPAEHSRVRRMWFRFAVVSVIMLLLFAVPWWTLLSAGTAWPTAVVVIGSVVFASASVGLPLAITFGHGRSHMDLGGGRRRHLAGRGLGAVRLVGAVPGAAADVVRGRGGGSGAVASRRPRSSSSSSPCSAGATSRRCGFRAYGPSTSRFRGWARDSTACASQCSPTPTTGRSTAPAGRRRWWTGSTRSTPTWSATSATSPTARQPCARRRRAPLASVRAKLARVYVTGNHEYFSEAHGWLDYMDAIGWDASAQQATLLLDRGGDQLVIAGVDDVTAHGSGVDGHGADLDAALAGADPALPVLLLAHQPKQVAAGGERRGSTCRSPDTPTAGRSGRSTSWSGSTNRWCRD